MSPRIPALVAAAALLASIVTTVPAAATHDGSGPHARATNDSCPAERVQPAFFGDVAAASTHRASIDCVVWWDVADGRSASQYAPLADVSRGQMATLLRNLLIRTGGDLPAPTKDHFDDDDGSVHEDSINRLAEAGIVAGRTDGTYGHRSPVQRGAMAAFLVRTYEHRSGAALPRPTSRTFTDTAGSTHEASIDKAAAAGIAAGIGGGAFAPRRPVQRGQVASFLARVLDLAVESGLAQPPPSRPGDFDPTFGDRGARAIAFGSAYAEAQDVAVGPGGTVLLAGRSSGDDDQDPTAHVAVARLLADGTPDPSFSGDGRVTTVVGATSGAEAVVVQPDGKVVVGGTVQPVAGDLDTDYLLIRYTADGALDPTFGRGGIVTSSFRGPAYLTDLVLQSDGRLVAGGSALVDRATIAGDLVLVRYLPNGAPDTAFGVDGRSELDVRGGPDQLGALALQPDGAILAAGASDVPAGASESQVTVARFRPDGSVDRAFGQDGVARTETGPFESLQGIALQSDGSIVVAGSNDDPGRTVRRMLLVRYDPTGDLDPTFGSGGIVITQAAPQSEAADVAVDLQDRLVVVGRGVDDANESGKSWLVVRHLPDGARDPSFGEGGVVRSAIGKSANAVAVRGGDILVAGCDCPFPPSSRGGFESRSSFVVARFRAA